MDWKPLRFMPLVALLFAIGCFANFLDSKSKDESNLHPDLPEGIEALYPPSWKDPRTCLTETKSPLGPQWWINTRRSMWTIDDLGVACDLYCLRDEESPIKLVSRELQLVLTPERRPPIVKVIDQKLDRGPYEMTGVAWGGFSGESDVFEYWIDLRQHFGGLPAGKYSFHAVLPGTSYRRRDGRMPNPDLVSPSVEFELLETSLEQARATSDPPKPGIGFDIIDVSEIDTDYQVTVRLTNRLKNRISFFDMAGKRPGYGRGGFADTWRPPGRWDRPSYDNPIGTIMCVPECHLSQGDSMIMKLPYPRLAPGIYRFCFSGWVGKDSNAKWCVHSDPFLIDGKGKLKSSLAVSPR